MIDNSAYRMIAFQVSAKNHKHPAALYDCQRKYSIIFHAFDPLSAVFKVLKSNFLRNSLICLYAILLPSFSGQELLYRYYISDNNNLRTQQASIRKNMNRFAHF